MFKLYSNKLDFSLRYGLNRQLINLRYKCKAFTSSKSSICNILLLFINIHVSFFVLATDLLDHTVSTKTWANLPIEY